MSANLLRHIEWAAVRGWPALEHQNVDGWRWRFTSGGSIRANSVAALDYTGADIDRTIDRVEALYHAQGAPSVFTVSDGSTPADLDARLAERGYVRGDDHVTMAKSVLPTVAFPPSTVASSSPPPGWMDAYLSGLSPDRRAIAPRLIGNLPKHGVMFVAHMSNESTTSSGLTVIDGPLASIQCMATLRPARGRGGAKAVLAAIEGTALQHGVSTLYLQTGGDNTAARALYAGVGFEIIGRYHTRTKVVAASAQT